MRHGRAGRHFRADLERDRRRVGIEGNVGDLVGDADGPGGEVLDLVGDADRGAGGEGLLEELGVDADVVLAPECAARIVHVDVGGACRRGYE